MKNTYDLCLLVDANKVSNLFNKITLIQSNKVKKVLVAENCLEAIKYISSKKSSHPIPDIIFLELNTPHMNGWEFLEKYNLLDDDEKKHIVIFDADSLNNEEKSKLNSYSFVKGFTKKEIDKDFLKEFDFSFNKKPFKS